LFDGFIILPGKPFSLPIGCKEQKNPLTKVKGQYHQAVGWVDAWLGFRNWTPVVVQ
jgi:hypothetical protein